MADKPQLPEGVGETAVGAAMMRARESAREGGLFDDPYAAMFVAAVPPIFEDGPTAEDEPALGALEAAFEDAVVVRTRFFDDFALDATANSCRQVVLLGAGFDTRAFRLDWPEGVRVFELDLPEVIAFKNRVLSENGATPRCERVTVPVDLDRADWPATLSRAGHEPGVPTASIIEGLIPYLTNDAAERVLTVLGRLSSPSSRLALDHAGGANDSLLNSAQGMAAMDQITAMWRGGLSDDPAVWLTQRGWEPETTRAEVLRERYGRVRAAEFSGLFVTARRTS